MNFAFLLKCKMPDGSVSHFVWQTGRHSTRAQAEKWVQKEFDENGVVAPGMKKNGTELLGVIDGGECREDDQVSTQKLFEDACKKAIRQDNKAKQPQAEPEKAAA